MLSTTLSTPIFCAASSGQPDAEARRRRRVRRGGRPGGRGCRPGPARVERGKALGGLASAAVGAAQSRPSARTVRPADRPRRLDRPLVDLRHLVGDARPGVALGAAAGGLAHRPQALGLVVDALQLLGQALRVGGRDQDAVDAVADDVAVAGDFGGDDRRAGGEGLGQHHAEALAGERGRAEHVGAVQLGPEALAGDAAADVDRAHQLGVGDVAEDVLAVGADHGEAAGNVLDQGAEGGQQDRQALALLGAADEEDPQLLAARRRRARRRVDVDPVGDDRVVAAVPAATGPGGRLGDGDPGREAVEHPPGAGRVGDVVGHRLGRVGVEGPDHRRPRAQRRVPADQRRQRLVDVDDVELVGAHRPARGDDPAARERRRGWRPTRWRRSRPCAPAGSGSPGSRAVRLRPRCRPRLIRPGGS